MSNRWFEIFSPILWPAFSLCSLFSLLCRSSLIWYSLTDLFLFGTSFFFGLCFWYQINHCQSQCQEFSPMFSSRSFTVSNFMIKSNLFWIDFCVCCKIRIQFHSFACRYPHFPILFVENTFSFPTVYSWNPVENHLTPCKWVYFRTLYTTSQLYFFTRVVAGNNGLGIGKKFGMFIWPAYIYDFMNQDIRTLAFERMQ